MPLRILHIFRPVDSDAGRSIDSVCEFSRAQRHFGHVIEIATLGRPGPAIERLGVPLHELPGGSSSYGYSPRIIPWIRERSRDFDCVVVHGIWDFCGVATWRALRDSSVPYFVFTHGMLDPWFKGRHPIRHLKRWVYWLWGGYPVLRDAHAVFFMSDDERQRAIEAFWLYDCHEFVVRPGTPGIPKAPVEDFAESFFWKHASLRGRRLFTFFAEHDEGEAVRTLARAVALLARRGTWDSQSMRLVIAGQGEQPARDDALKIAADLGIGEGVHWTGALTEREKWGLLAASEAFLRPTAHEICSTRVFDALSAGTPVLVSDGVATWKDIVNDGAGLAGSNTPGGFERMLASWISLPADERAAMRARARRCFEANYTLVGAAHALTSAVYFLIGIHRDSRWDLRPLKPASELA